MTTPLPCDLAHRLDVEIEGVPGRFRAGSVVVSGQESGLGLRTRDPRRFPLGPIAGLPPDAIDRPGERRIRLVLTADPDLGWADPDVRSRLARHADDRLGDRPRDPAVSDVSSGQLSDQRSAIVEVSGWLGSRQ